jgi:hypothetical protein
MALHFIHPNIRCISFFLSVPSGPQTSGREVATKLQSWVKKTAQKGKFGTFPR